jgi:hypothetical protein
MTLMLLPVTLLPRVRLLSLYLVNPVLSRVSQV